MGNKFASGRIALATCDRCGQTVRLRTLRELIVKTKKTNIMVCHPCWDADHPQLLIGTFPVSDPQALRNPRVDQSLGAAGNQSSRDTQWGWAPVGGGSSLSAAPNNLVSTTHVGTVTINAT